MPLPIRASPTANPRVLIKIIDYRSQFLSTLSPLYNAAEVERFFYLLLEHKRALKRVDLAVNRDLTFNAQEVAQWDNAIERLKRFEPIQYIIGSTMFFGLEFEVSPDVLIPRPETEELVQWILSNNPVASAVNPRILDIGTGSGCIAVSLAKNLPDASVYAIDVSDGALKIAQRNATRNAARMTLLHQDILQTVDLGRTFDIIVSNPPYVRELEKNEIRPNVLDYEPHSALFVANDDALVFYRKIADLALRNLSPNGQLYFEINQYLGNQTMDLLQMQGFSQLELRTDLYGNDRMIYARL